MDDDLDFELDDLLCSSHHEEPDESEAFDEYLAELDDILGDEGASAAAVVDKPTKTAPPPPPPTTTAAASTTTTLNNNSSRNKKVQVAPPKPTKSTPPAKTVTTPKKKVVVSAPPPRKPSVTRTPNSRSLSSKSSLAASSSTPSPAKASPAKASPAKASPAKASPAKPSPAKASPAKPSPAKPSPGKRTPTKPPTKPKKKHTPKPAKKSSPPQDDKKTECMTVSLNNNNNNNTEDATAQDFIDNTKSLQQLVLRGDMEAGTVPTSEDLEKIARGVRSLHDLKVLSFELAPLDEKMAVVFEHDNVLGEVHSENIQKRKAVFYEFTLHLLEAIPPTLEELNLRLPCNNDDDAEFKILFADRLARTLNGGCPRLAKITIHAGMHPDGAEEIAAALKKCPFLWYLCLRCDLGDEGVQAFAEQCLENNRKLKVLSLALNKIGDDGARSIAEHLKDNTCVTRLDLSSNQIRNDGITALAECLKSNKVLSILDLDNNFIGSEAIESVSRALRENQTLTELNIRGVMCDLAGTMALRDIVHTLNRTILRIKVDVHSTFSDLTDEDSLEMERVEQDLMERLRLNRISSILGHRRHTLWSPPAHPSVRHSPSCVFLFLRSMPLEYERKPPEPTRNGVKTHSKKKHLTKKSDTKSPTTAKTSSGPKKPPTTKTPEAKSPRLVTPEPKTKTPRQRKSKASPRTSASSPRFTTPPRFSTPPKVSTKNSFSRIKSPTVNSSLSRAASTPSSLARAASASPARRRIIRDDRPFTPSRRERCDLPYAVHLHGAHQACERCLERLSNKERAKFEASGHHHAVMFTHGGCSHNCCVYPRSIERLPVRLCRQCFHDTHRPGPASGEYYRGSHRLILRAGMLIRRSDD